MTRFPGLGKRHKEKGGGALGPPAQGLHPSSAQQGFAVTEQINIYDCLLGNSIIATSQLNTSNTYTDSSGKCNLCMC